MSVSQRCRLQGSRFLCLCFSNWFLNIYVWAIVPLMAYQSGTVPTYGAGVAWAVLAFAVGMLLPGPCCARLLEWRSRKTVYLKSLVAMAILSLVAWMGGPGLQTITYGLSGLCFGIAQTALGSTLVNDVLLSPYRNRGDIVYAWAGRLGMPVGLLLGVLMPTFMPLGQAWLCAVAACGLAFILVAQTPVPVKAPVRVPLFTCDRFILPRTLPLSLSLLPAPLALGMVIATAGTVMQTLLCIGIGFTVVFVVQLCVRRHVSQLLAVGTGYALMLAGLAIHYLACGPMVPQASLILLSMGAAVVMSRHLIDWVTWADHCQRGTAQNTCLLVSRLSFGAGFLVGVLCGRLSEWLLISACVVAMLIYTILTHNHATSMEQR